MKTMKHVMIDCETFGLKPTSAITTIGAVEFDPYDPGSIGLPFHEAISLYSAMEHGLTVDASTILWWLKQPEESQFALVQKIETGRNLSTVLIEFTQYLGRIGLKQDVKLWSCGSRDFEWLENAYTAVKWPVPWGYRTGDYRTIRDEFMQPGDEPPVTLSHDAFADAMWQARLLQNIFARLRGDPGVDLQTHGSVGVSEVG